jgi:hypothetical protein
LPVPAPAIRDPGTAFGSALAAWVILSLTKCKGLGRYVTRSLDGASDLTKT